MKRFDDRTDRQMQSHQYLVIGTDTFLSGRGETEGGKSYAVWACRDNNEQKEIMAWVESRSDMNRVRLHVGAYKPHGKGHCHVYVVSESHPALKSMYRNA